MTSRERLLGIAVGILVVSISSVWIFGYVSASFETRHEELAKVQQEKSEKEAKIRRGEKASKQLAGMEKRSLSSDINVARSQYLHWLLGATKNAGLKVEVKHANQHAHMDVYVAHTFSVTGEAEPRKLIQFFHDFYNVGYLHRIGSASITPVKDKKLLEVTLMIDALSLNKAPVEGSDPPPVEKPLTKSAQEYADAIIRRNYFAPANNSPRIASPGTQRGNPNKTLSFSVKATDPDKLDKVTYSLETKLEGAKIDPNTGEFRMTPSKLGEYEAIVRATDDGIPAKSTEEKIKIVVVEAPVQPKENPFLKDDPARDAKITAMVGPADKLQVWVTVPRGLGDQPKTLHLNAGDKIKVGSFSGVVKKVRDREAEFHLDDGRTVVVRLEQSLVPSDKESGGL